MKSDLASRKDGELSDNNNKDLAKSLCDFLTVFPRPTKQKVFIAADTVGLVFLAIASVALRFGSNPDTDQMVQIILITAVGIVSRAMFNLMKI